MAPDCHHHCCPPPSAFNHSRDHECHDHEISHECGKDQFKPFGVRESNNATNNEGQNKTLTRLKISALLCFLFFLVELAGGAIAGSLAVLSDAAHRATDVFAYLVAIMGSYVASLPASKNYTFGLKRTESIVALFSMASLMVVSICLAVEASQRIWKYFRDPDEMDVVNGKIMFFTGLFGVVVNVILALVLGEHHVHLPGVDHAHDHSHDHGHGQLHHEESLDEPLLLEVDLVHELPRPHVHDDNISTTENTTRNVNLHAAYIHALADLAESVAVLIAGLVIWWKPSWKVADPICTVIFSVLVSLGTIGVIKASLYVLLEKVPPGIQWDEIHQEICQVPGVTNLHDLHIWSVSHGNPILSLHATAENVEQAYDDIKRICNRQKISKMTLQIQSSAHSSDCVTCVERDADKLLNEHQVVFV